MEIRKLLCKKCKKKVRRAEAIYQMERRNKKVAVPADPVNKIIKKKKTICKQ